MRLKENTLYLVADDGGWIGAGESGLYRRDTRFLSRLQWRVAGQAPTVLWTHSPEPYRFAQHASEPELGTTQRLEFRREGALDGADYVETVRLRPFDELSARTLPWGRSLPDLREIELHLDADFADLFEVRGLPPVERAVAVAALPDGLEFACVGNDGVRRRTRVRIEPMGELLDAAPAQPRAEAPVTLDAPGTLALGAAPPATRQLAGRVVRWRLGPDLLRDGRLEVRVTVTAVVDGEPGRRTGLPVLAAEYRAWRAATAVKVDNRVLQRVFDRAANDLRALLFDTPQGPIPAAGIPWFVAPFGRDSIWVALMTLPWRPEIARGTLGYLAAHQGTRTDPRSLEAPGKILHEQRDGEAARTGRIPFRTYFGSVDSTPLWLCLLGEYLEWTGDLEGVRRLRPNLEAALDWMDGPDVDPDGDGFLEYLPHAGGITNQVWKDSGDSVFDECGRDLEPPIAPVEVQAYAYRARLAAAAVLRALGDAAGAGEQERRARVLAGRFHEAFWLEELGFYAHALDARKRPARVLTSNPGHCLWAGIVPPERAGRLAEALLAPAMWSGWGVRTLAEGSPRYNPVSYHNGSVWPHDNAVAALGLARYGLADAARRLASAQLEAAALAPDARLPELFAGFARETAEGLPDSPPVPYPAACHPQAWDAAAPFAFLRAVLDLRPDGRYRQDGLPSGWGGVGTRVRLAGRELDIGATP